MATTGYGRYGGGLAVVAASEPRAARPRGRCGGGGAPVNDLKRERYSPPEGAAQVGDPAAARARLQMSEEGLLIEQRMRQRAASEPRSKRGGAAREQT